MKKSLLSLRGCLCFMLMGMAGYISADTTWNFSNITEADRSNMNADAANWTYDSSGDRWKNVNSMTSAPLIANGVELDVTKGLRVTTTGADNVRVDNKKQSLTLNKKSASITIPDLKAGDVVTISGVTSGATDRYIKADNINVTSGFKTDGSDNVGVVIADGDVTFSATGGFYIKSITVKGDGGSGSGGGGGTITSDHSVKMNAYANQMSLTTTDGSLKYYNTAELGEVNLDKARGAVTVTPLAGDWNDEYMNNVRAINFSVASSIPDSGGDVVSGGLVIKESRGWLECVYAKWELMTGADSYNVYIKGGKYDNFTKVDRELVRRYPDYGRVDIPGLPAGAYSIRIVPVKGNAEDESSAATVSNLGVRAYDRTGFAFHPGSGAATYDGGGIGAYKENGELKDNARVIYVTAETARTVKCMVFYEKADKEFTGLQEIINAYQKGTAKNPLCVRIIGTIRDTDMDKLLSGEEGLQVKGKNAYAPMNITFEGIGEDAALWGFGVLIRNCSSVEFRNLASMLCMDDCLSFDTKNAHCWIHHMDFFYGNAGGDNDQAKGDGTVDLKGNTRYITIAYNHFWDCGKTSLCGMKSESTEDFADYHHNWFDHSDSRHPRVRTITTHVWNNYYDGTAKYGVGATSGCNIFVEGNFYRSSKYPMLISKQGWDGKGSGTFSGEPGGMIKSYGNVYAEALGNARYMPITQTASATDFDCFEASYRDEVVPDTYKTKDGATQYSNFDTDPVLMHVYKAVPAVEVPAIVTGYYGAGRLNKGDFTYDLNYTNADGDYNVISGLKEALKNYKSSLVGIF